jgi:hypothetical protein
MPLFGGGGEPSVRPRRTLSGRPVSVQEDIGTIERRGRLMAEAVRRLKGHPLAEESAHRVALGDGHGMEGLVEHVAPLFRREMSLARWVAIRGALLFLDMICPSDREWQELMPIMGLAPGMNPETNEPTAAVLSQASPVSPEVEQNILGLFWAITIRWNIYDEVSEMSVQQVNADPRWAGVGPPMALDFIAWAAVAMIRTGQESSELISKMPEPGLLEEPGWYADPLFARCERYWTGDDWTGRVRFKNGRAWKETNMPLH